MNGMAVVDAADAVMGRLASVVAKRLLGGEEVVIVNAEKALITGKPSSVHLDYRTRRTIGSQRKGPFYPRRPDQILRRTVRGMIPYQKPAGRAALKRLRVYLGVPAEYADKERERIAQAERVRTARVVRLGDVSRQLGSKFEGRS